LRAELSQLQAHDTTILVVASTPDEASDVGAVDQADRAVVTQQQVVGDLADGRASRVAVATDGQ
jgi:hypothetical protein